MIRQVGAEILKVFTTRAWWVLAIIMFVYVGFTAAIFGGAIGYATDQTTTDQTTIDGGVSLGGLDPTGLVFSLASSVGYVFPVLLGCLLVTAEYRSHTIVPTFLAQPNRTVVLLAKGAVGLVVGFVLGVIGVASSVLPGAAALQLTHAGLLDDIDGWMLVRIVVVFMLWCLVGVALGALLQNQVVTIVVIIAFTQFLEPILRSLSALWTWTEQVARFLPGSSADTFVGRSIYNEMAAQTGTSSALEWWQGGLLLLSYAVVFGVAAALTRWRRDVS